MPGQCLIAQQWKPAACGTIAAMASIVTANIMLLTGSQQAHQKRLLRSPDRTAGWSICVPLRSTEPALLYCASGPVHRPLLAQALPLLLLECVTGLHWASGPEQTDGCGRCTAMAASLGGRHLSSHRQSGPHLDL